MKYNLLIILLLPLSTFAQKGKISGRVEGAQHEPLESINIGLHNAADSTIVQAVATNSSGEFTLEDIPSGEYFIQYTSIGFEKIHSAAFLLNEGETKILLPQTIAAQVETLGEVEVVYTRPLIEIKADRTVFNVEGTTNAIGLNALELLRKAPGVIVDNNDKIMVKGKAGVTVYIDGKLTPLDSEALSQMLKNMQSSNIESIEIITNPSAKYDAAGNAGIINIKLKKNKNFGTNGSIVMGIGTQRYTKYNTGLSINHRNKKWNLFGNYGNNWGDRWDYMNENRTQNDLSFIQNSYSVNGGLNQNFKGGIDYTINSKHVIGAMITGNTGKNGSKDQSRTRIGSIALSSSDSILVALNQSDGLRNNLNYNINYRFEDTLGYSLGVDADYGDYTIRNNTYQPNTYFNPDESLIFNQNNYQNNTATDIRIASLKADYEQDLLKGKLSLGFKFSNVRTSNELQFFTIENGKQNLDTSRSNKFDYAESINAGYFSYNRNFGKWGVQAGLRAEQTQSKGRLTSLNAQNNAEVDRKYLNFFPSTALTYNQNESSVFNLTYSRRIDRPSYQNLNPFEYRLDELSYSRGNAFLKPQYSDILEFTHTFKSTLNTSLTYSHTNGFFAEINDTTGVAASYIQPRNLGYQEYYSFSVSSPVPIKKWWNAYAYLNIYQLYNNATFDESKKINMRVTSYSLYLQQTFSITKTWNVELTSFYNGPGVWGGSYKNRPFGGMDMGVKKELFKKRASLRFAYGDLLRTMHWRGISNYGGQYIDVSGGWESQQFRISFTWNFGNQELKIKDKQSGSEDLDKRVK